MSDMKRLLDDTIAPAHRDLLRSAEDDVPPSPDARQARVLAAIAASQSVGTSPLPARTGPVVRPGGLDAIWRTWRWGLPLAGMVVIGGAAYLRGVDSAEKNPPSMGDDHASVATPVDESRPAIDSAPPPSSSFRVEDLPNAASDVEAPSRPAARPAAPSSVTGPSLDTELAAIDAARAALAAGRSADALVNVQRYRKTFADPHFLVEADAIEIQALAASGQRDEARLRARAFLVAHPQSPYAQRVRSAAGLNDGSVN